MRTCCSFIHRFCPFYLIFKESINKNHRKGGQFNKKLAQYLEEHCLYLEPDSACKSLCLSSWPDAPALVGGRGPRGRAGMCAILFGVSEHLPSSLQCRVGNWPALLPGCPQTPARCGDLERNTHPVFSRGLEPGQQMWCRTLEDRSPCAAGFSVSEQEEIPPV